MNFNKITLSRSKVITPAQLKYMRDHVKELINEATQEEVNPGAISIAKLITSCIENLKKQGFYYIQGDQAEIGYLYDELLKELTVIENEENDDNSINGGKNSAKRKKKINKKTNIIIEQELDESKRNAEFIYPFTFLQTEYECSLNDEDFNYCFDDELFDFPFGKDI